MVWAWMHWLAVSVCSWATNGIMVWAWMHWLAYVLGTRTELWLGHGCSGQCMLLEHERNYGLDMDALVSVCSWNAIGIMVSAWMLWLAYMLLEHERNSHRTPGKLPHTPRLGFVPRRNMNRAPTTCTILVLLRTDPCPRHLPLRPPFPKPKLQNKFWGRGGVVNVTKT